MTVCLSPEPRYSNAVYCAMGDAWQATFDAMETMLNLADRGIQFDEYPFAIGAARNDYLEGVAGVWPQYPPPVDWGAICDAHTAQLATRMFEGFPTSGYDFAGVPEPTPEPQPALPVEVHHTQAFNESAAWEAVVALSKGM